MIVSMWPFVVASLMFWSIALYFRFICNKPMSPTKARVILILVLWPIGIPLWLVYELINLALYALPKGH